MRNIPRHAWKALFAAQVGWMLDAMDFLLFTYALRSIQKEFALESSTMGLLTTVALVAAAAGGIAFGRVADRIGRVRAMTWTMFLYSFATAGLATSHSVWQLVFWRVLVGIGMGGEWACGSVLVAESWPREHRAKAAGIMQSGWAIGALIAAGMSALVLERYGWRVLFALGVLPAIVAFFIRRNVEEPQLWKEQRGTTARFGEMFEGIYARRTIVATLVAASVLIAYWGLMSWLPAFLATPITEGGAGLTVTKSAIWTVLIQLGALAGYLSFGFLADLAGRRLTFTFFMIAAAITVPTYALGARNSGLLLVLGFFVGYFAHGYFSVFGALLAELFPTRIRGTAQGFCYNAGRLASAAAPYAIGVAAKTQGLGVALAVNSLFFAVAGVLVWMLPETRGQDLTQSESVST